MFLASVESGVGTKVALRMTWPLTTFGVVLIGPSVAGTTAAIPVIDFNFAVIAGAAASVVQTSVGCPSPPEKYLTARFWAFTESGTLVKLCAVEIPLAWSVVAKPAKITRRSPVAAQYWRGLRAVAFATFDQRPESFSSSDPNFGIRGQKTQRPKRTSTAGRRVIIVMTAQAIPTAPTGPSPRLLERLARRSKRSEIATVEPDATIGSTTPRQAFFIASKRDSSW